MSKYNCRFCGKPLKQSKTGRRRVYCDDACQQGAYRARRRYQVNPSHVAERVEAQQAEWRAQGIPDELIQELMDLWYACGGQAIDTVNRILVVHKMWAVKKYLEEKINATDKHTEHLRNNT